MCMLITDIKKETSSYMTQLIYMSLFIVFIGSVCRYVYNGSYMGPDGRQIWSADGRCLSFPLIKIITN